MTKKAYITHGLSGWTICFWNGSTELRYLHGYAAFDVALTVLKMFWDTPPDYQNGFPTLVELP